MSQLWSAGGGYYASTKLSDKLRYALQPIVRFRQFCDIEEAIGKNAGESLSFNIYGKVARKGGAIPENAPMPETTFPVKQVTVSMSEFGNSVPYSGKLDDLSEHPIVQIIHKTLKEDARDSLDAAAHAEFNQSPLCVVPAGASFNSETDIILTENGTPAGANNSALTKSHVKKIADLMQERNIPTYDGEDYCALGRPTSFRPFKDELEAVNQYTTEGWKQIMNGESGRYEGIRFFTQTAVATEGWANAKSDAVFFFGADTVTEAIAVPEEIRGKIPDDYGRGRGIAWYSIMGYALTHPLLASDAAQCRIIKWDSAS
jgi:N4-gp56 family major capsid protein